jgi:hypothetical protein
MAYRGAAIDVHKMVLIVAVATAADEVKDPAGEALEFEMPPLRGGRAGTDESDRMVTAAGCNGSGHGIDRSILETSVAGSGAPFRSCIWHKRIPTARRRAARMITGTPGDWPGAFWRAS